MQGMGDFLNEMAAMMTQTKPDVSSSSSSSSWVNFYIFMDFPE